MGFFNRRGYYKHHVYCPNCNNNIGVEIKRGTKVNDYCKDRECYVCGCKPIKDGKKPETYY